MEGWLEERCASSGGLPASSVPSWETSARQLLSRVPLSWTECWAALPKRRTLCQRAPSNQEGASQRSNRPDQTGVELSSMPPCLHASMPLSTTPGPGSFVCSNGQMVKWSSGQGWQLYPLALFWVEVVLAPVQGARYCTLHDACLVLTISLLPGPPRPKQAGRQAGSSAHAFREDPFLTLFVPPQSVGLRSFLLESIRCKMRKIYSISTEYTEIGSKLII